MQPIEVKPSAHIIVDLISGKYSDGEGFSWVADIADAGIFETKEEADKECETLNTIADRYVRGDRLLTAGLAVIPSNTKIVVRGVLFVMIDENK